MTENEIHSSQMPPFDERFDAYVGAVLRDWRTPGAVMSVLKHGEYAFVKGYGVRERGTTLPADGQTLISVASCTKSFTAAAVGILVSEGKLSWDDPVRKHIPEFRFASDFVTEQTTIRDILLHRASLPGILGDFMDPAYSAGDLLRDLQTSEPVCGFRERCVYSQVGMALIGEAIGRVSGLRWRDFVTQRILEPLGMASSYADAHCLEQALGDPDSVENRFVPLRQEGETLTSHWAGVYSIYAAAAGMITTGEDVVPWMEMLLGKGTYRDTRLIAAEAVQEMHTPQMMVDTVWGAPWKTLTQPFAHLVASGLGWIAYEYQDRQVVEHAGANAGSSVVALIPEEGLGVAVFANASYTWPESERMVAALKLAAVDRVLGTAQRDWSEVFAEVHRVEAARG